MIRKLVGSMVLVAKERISLNTLEKMMLCPHEFYEDETNISILTPQGLFLKKVHYDPNSFEYTEKDYESYLECLNKELKPVETDEILNN
jgi:tRNA U38,U39,U40 pseudouridine synthase TruA